MKMDGWIRIGTIVDLDGLKSGVAKVKNTLSKVVGGLGKTLGLGIGAVVLGAIATGMYILSKAIDKANGETGQLQANLSYIGFVGSKIFENLLTPAIDKTTGAINGLVGALYKVVVYLGYILSEWTGKDLFEGTSVDDYANAMEKANKSASGTAKSTAKIKKDLMSFDEINKLSDDTSGSSGSGGITMPNLPNLGEVPIPDWVKWIGDHKEDILKIVGALAGLFLVIKGLDLANKLSPLLQLFGFGGGTGGSGGMLSTIGKYTLIFASFYEIFKDIGIWVETQKQIAKDTEEVRKTGLKTNKQYVQDHKKINDLAEGLRQKLLQQEEVEDDINHLSFLNVGLRKTYTENLKNSLLIQDEYIDGMIEMYRNGELNESQQEYLLQVLMNQRDNLSEQKTFLEEQGADVSDLVGLSSKYKDVLKEMGVEFEEHTFDLKDAEPTWEELNKQAGTYYSKQEKVNSITNGIKNMALDVLDATKQINSVRLEDKTFKVKVDKTALMEMIRALPNKINLGFGVSFDTSKIKKAFGLAKGGIINNPGGGVPLGTNIIGGERGNEAVIPLNDETMDRLGSAIARHMNVNLTNITQMNGRTIGRELKQIANENDFSYNG